MKWKGDNIKSVKSLFFRYSSLAKYAVVGVLSLAIDYLSLVILYRVFEVGLTYATLVAFIVGLIVNFVGNKFWSFNADNTRASNLLQAVSYLMLVGFNTFFTVFAVVRLDELGIEPEVSKPFCVGLITLWNFWIYKNIIFKNTT